VGFLDAINNVSVWIKISYTCIVQSSTHQFYVSVIEVLVGDG